MQLHLAFTILIFSSNILAKKLCYNWKLINSNGKNKKVILQPKFNINNSIIDKILMWFFNSNFIKNFIKYI